MLQKISQNTESVLYSFQRMYSHLVRHRLTEETVCPDTDRIRIANANFYLCAFAFFLYCKQEEASFKSGSQLVS